jgi:hypothetical protein
MRAAILPILSNSPDALSAQPMLFPVTEAE